MVLAANHVSWFDGFLAREAQRHLRPDAVFRTLMLASELKRSRTLRALGGMGFDPSRPLSLRSVLRALSDVRDDGLVVAFFPQGRIYPSFRRPLGFEPGLGLLTRTLAPCTVVGLGLHLEQGNHLAPRAFIHATAPLRIPADEEAEVAEVERRVQDALEAIHRELARWGEDAWKHWPSEPTGALSKP